MRIDENTFENSYRVVLNPGLHSTNCDLIETFSFEYIAHYLNNAAPQYQF
jgi:hypothetical protein